MTESEFEELKELSGSMFDDVCDPTSLASINLEALTSDAVIKLFLSSKCSKSDFEVLNGLMGFWNKRTSTISFDSFNLYRTATNSTLLNANLSRAIKNLEKLEFIQKLDESRKLEFFFNVSYTILRNEHTERYRQ